MTGELEAGLPEDLSLVVGPGVDQGWATSANLSTMALISCSVVYAAECHAGRQRGPGTQAAQLPSQRRHWFPM